MEHFTCKMDNQGRITLPASWRKTYHVEPGTALTVTSEEDGLHVKTLEQSVREAQRIVAAHFGKSKKSLVEELFRERRREARLEERKAAKYAKYFR